MKSPIIQMTHADYLAHKAYGSTDIIRMGRSFAYYKHRKENPEKIGRPFVVGSATHLLLQSKVTNDPALAKNGILIYKDGSSLTKGFKEFQTLNASKYCLDAEEDELTQRMVLAILNEPEVMGYLKGAIPEATVLANFPGTEIPCKVRPDYFHVERGVSINFKTTSDASESGFIYSARDYGYDWQSSFYCAILSAEFGKPVDEVHILVEKGDSDSECIVNIFSFGDDTLGFARSQIFEVLQKIPGCEKSGVWPKNQAYLQTVDLPGHMRKVVHL